MKKKKEKTEIKTKNHINIKIGSLSTKKLNTTCFKKKINTTKSNNPTQPHFFD